MAEIAKDYSNVYVADVLELYHAEGEGLDNVAFEERTLFLCESKELAEAWAKQAIEDFNTGLEVDVFGNALDKTYDDSVLVIEINTLARLVSVFADTYVVTQVRQEF